MLGDVLKKMVSREWMTLSLAAGFVLATALVSSVPVYTSGVLQRLLESDLEALLEDSAFPGRYRVEADFEWLDPSERSDALESVSGVVETDLLPAIPLPLIAERRELSLGSFRGEPAVPREEDPPRRYLDLRTFENLEDNSVLLAGRWPSDTPADGVYEGVVLQSMPGTTGFLLDEVLTVRLNQEQKVDVAKVRITGIIRPDSPDNLYWPRDLIGYARTLFLDYGLFMGEFVDRSDAMLETAVWDHCLDWRSIAFGDLDRLIREMDWQARVAAPYRGALALDFAPEEILRSYARRGRELRIGLWVILVPVLLLSAFYILMVSDMAVRSEADQISVMKSRGLSNRDVLARYLAETAVLCAAALAAGPPLGVVVSRFIGSADGFLTFVRRPPIESGLGPDVYLAALGTVASILVVRMVPVLAVARKSIVELKRDKARPPERPFWQRARLDAACLAVSVYGAVRFRRELVLWRESSASGPPEAMDPLLFLSSTLFILGLGLAFLRLYPPALGGVIRLGRKKWSPVAYPALMHARRSGGRSAMLMLFVLFSVACGLFNARTARTLNRNMADRYLYANGADLVLEPRWAAQYRDDGTGTVSLEQAMETADSLRTGGEGLMYREPDFGPFRDLSGAEHAARVFRTDDAELSIGSETLGNVNVMGLEPYDFGKTAWFREDLLPYHWFHYLNLLAAASDAALVSTDLRELYGLELGDRIYVAWDNQRAVPVTVSGFIGYWPAYDPLSDRFANRVESQVVANLAYLHATAAISPYEVWIRRAPLATDAGILGELEAAGVVLDAYRSSTEQIVKGKNDPLLQGLNGGLTQGFLITLLLCLMGYLLAGLISLHERSLQFGIVRAMGLGRGELMRIILWEQAITIGSAIAIGVAVGTVASLVFIPSLQAVFPAAGKTPPFRMATARSDALRIYVSLALIILAGGLSTASFLKGMDIGSALKLGED